MSRIALFGALIAAALLTACTQAVGTRSARTAADENTPIDAKTEYPEDRRFIWGIPQNSR